VVGRTTAAVLMLSPRAEKGAAIVSASVRVELPGAWAEPAGTRYEVGVAASGAAVGGAERRQILQRRRQL